MFWGRSGSDVVERDEEEEDDARDDIEDEHLDEEEEEVPGVDREIGHDTAK